MIEALIRRQPCRERYVLTGFVSDEELATLYADAELFVYPSLYEGFGTPLLEAMGSGLPIVAPSVASTREVAGDAALFYGDPLETEFLAAKIAEVLDHPTLQDQLARKGRVRASGFTYDNIMSQYLEAYQSVL